MSLQQWLITLIRMLPMFCMLKLVIALSHLKHLRQPWKRRCVFKSCYFLYSSSYVSQRATAKRKTVIFEPPAEETDELYMQLKRQKVQGIRSECIEWVVWSRKMHQHNICIAYVYNYNGWQHDYAILYYTSIGKKLGSGYFGNVYKGEMRDDPDDEDSTEVAIKTLNKKATERDKVKFLQEAAIMAQFNHTNVLKLYGVVVTKTSVCIMAL